MQSPTTKGPGGYWLVEKYSINHELAKNSVLF